jgi:hypothetical protein
VGEDGKIQSESDYGQTLQIVPPSPPVAQYEVTLSTETNFTNGILTVLAGSTELLHFINGTRLNSSRKYETYYAMTSFEFPESMISSNEPAVLSLSGKGAIIIRHGDPVDLINWLYDSAGWGSSLMLCKIKPGTYYVTILYYKPMGENTLTWGSVLLPNPESGSLPDKEPHFGDGCKQ